MKNLIEQCLTALWGQPWQWNKLAVLGELVYYHQYPGVSVRQRRIGYKVHRNIRLGMLRDRYGQQFTLGQASRDFGDGTD